MKRANHHGEGRGDRAVFDLKLLVASVAVALVVYFALMFPWPADEEVAGTIGGVQKAEKYQAEQITGLQTGGISPLALLQRNFQVVLDETAKSQDQIYISGGQRGINIRLPTKELVRLTKAKFAPISRFEVR